MTKPIRRVLGLLVALGMVLGLAACENASARSQQEIPLRIGILGSPTLVTDPAIASDTASVGYVYNVFQRLMGVEVGTGYLKPDLATECLFIDELTYSCSLQGGVRFTNGNKLTSSDVAFSIERAMNLADAGSAATHFSSIDEIEVVDEFRVDFHLKHPDNQFGHLMASPAASIVDEEVYSKTRKRSPDLRAIGSGPVQVVERTDDQIRFWTNFDYRGRNPAQTINQTLISYPDAASLAAAAEAGEVDVVWDADGIDEVPGEFHQENLTNAHVQWLRWNPESALRDQADLREYVRDGTQSLRTSQSLLLPTTDTYAPVFATGERQPRSPQPATLRLWHADEPQQQQLAEDVAEALRQDPNVTVELTRDRAAADVWVEETSAWMNTPLAWLQPWLDHPLPGTEERNHQAVVEMRMALTQPTKQAPSTQLQQWAHDDATVVPLTVGDKRIYLGPTVELPRDNDMFNYLPPNYQLGVWGFKL